MLSGVTGIIDGLAIANTWHKSLNPRSRDLPFHTEIVSLDGNPVTAVGDLPLHPGRSFRDVEHTDLILLPAFLPLMKKAPRKFHPFFDWLHERRRGNVQIGAMCTGTFLLAESGLLDGKMATTNWYFADIFKKRYPRVRLMPEKIITVDNGLICSGAANAHINLSVYIMKHFGSEELASICSKTLLIDTNRESQAPYMISDFRKDHGDRDVKLAQNWIELNYSEPISIDSLASNIGLSSRHFKRRFKDAVGESPISYVQRVRIEAAKKKLETSMDNINEIILQVGYEDGSSFSRLFKKSTGLTPREYRQKFSRSGEA